MNPNENHSTPGSGEVNRVALIVAGLILSMLCACTHTAFAAQVYRIDPNPIMTTSGNVPFGGYPQLYAIPGATIQLCTDSACATPATAYTDATGNTACSASAPVTLPGTTTCTSASGQQGQFGFWISPGTYYFKITTPNGQSFGPYPISSPNSFTVAGAGIVSADNSGALAGMTSNLDVSRFTGASGSAKITTAIAALPVTGGTLQTVNLTGSQAWNSDAFLGVTKPIDFLCTATTFTVSVNSTIPANVHLIAGAGCIFSVNMAITLTINGPLDGTSLSQHFSGAGTILFTSNSKVVSLWPQWWGAVGDASTDNSVAIQAAEKAVKTLPAQAGEIAFSSGIFMACGLTTDVGVNWKGQGKFATAIRSNCASNLWTKTQGGIGSTHDWLKGMTLDANSMAPIAMALTNIGNFEADDFIVQGATVSGIAGTSLLLSTFSNCAINNSVIGFWFGGSSSNQNVLRDCSLNTNTSWGISGSNGTLALQHTDGEGNGTLGNASTGFLHLSNMCPLGEGMGLEVYGGNYSESNKGYAVFDIRGGSSVPCAFNFWGVKAVGTTTTYGIKATGANLTYSVMATTITGTPGPTGAGGDIWDDATITLGYVGAGSVIGGGNFGTRTVVWPDPTEGPSGRGVFTMAASGGTSPQIFPTGGTVSFVSATGANASVINVSPSSGGFSVIDCDKIGAGSALPCQIQTGGVNVAVFGNNGGNGQLLVNTTSTDFSSAIFGSLGTMAVVSAATNAKVLALNASGGDGKTQIVVTKSGAGTTQPLEIFSDSTLLATLQPASALKIAGTGQTLGTTAGTFAQLPVAPTAGDCKWITDSMSAVFGAVIAGAGANKVNACYDGTNWTVH